MQCRIPTTRNRKGEKAFACFEAHGKGTRDLVRLCLCFYSESLDGLQASRPCCPSRRLSSSVVHELHPASWLLTPHARSFSLRFFFLSSTLVVVVWSSCLTSTSSREMTGSHSSTQQTPVAVAPATSTQINVLCSCTIQRRSECNEVYLTCPLVS